MFEVELSERDDERASGKATIRCEYIELVKQRAWEQKLSLDEIGMGWIEASDEIVVPSRERDRGRRVVQQHHCSPNVDSDHESDRKEEKSDIEVEEPEEAGDSGS